MVVHGEAADDQGDAGPPQQGQTFTANKHGQYGRDSGFSQGEGGRGARRNVRQAPAEQAVAEEHGA
ncbi:hypothetical protein Sfulv_61600 [Streptomyces fulvorobeus]|uniref:Uncharacterized protein n=1 Tax=Streptomyces fulvorobeus TaxID=284028 RepID=A0A7J0CFS4_9ACTN|nr:hypothetical protein Sfulv_61600 [Streptomyces fulvorobeus]